MSDKTTQSRRRFVGCSSNDSRGRPTKGFCSVACARPATATQGAAKALPTSFAPLKQVKAGVLDVGYAEDGPVDGPVALLLHGWPYDIHTYVEVAPLLARKGYRVIVPHLRGTARRGSSRTARCANGQQGVLALDAIALMDALEIDKAVWRVAIGELERPCIVAAIAPERCKALVSVSGYLIGSPRSKSPSRCHLQPSFSGGIQYYFATERGRVGYDTQRREFALANLANRIAEMGVR